MASNLELARAIYAGWDRGDYDSTEWADPEIEFVIADWLGPGSWTGLAGMAEGFRDLLNAWEGFRTVAEEFRELDADRVLAIVHFGGQGKASGLEVDKMGMKGASLFQFRDGKVVRLVLYLDLEHALGDLGLARQARSIDQAVSPEILAQFKEGFECWNRDELDRMQDMYAEDGVFDVSAVFTDVAPMHGHESMRGYWNELHETWSGIHLEPLEAFDVGGGRFAVDVRMWGKGQRSGIEIDQRFGMLYSFQADGKIASAQMLPDVAAAISAAGSSTEAG